MIGLFLVVARIANLRLNVAKTQVWVIIAAGKEAVMSAIRTTSPDLPLAAFVNMVKYLGIYIGPGGREASWTSCLTGYSEAARFCRSMGMGFNSAITLYNIIALSKLMYVGSFYSPDSRAIEAERDTVQRVTGIPWQAFSREHLFSLRKFGCRTQA
eukprot:3055243-Alexandrium_andersonii.AAC.1